MLSFLEGYELQTQSQENLLSRTLKYEKYENESKKKKVKKEKTATNLKQLITQTHK